METDRRYGLVLHYRVRVFRAYAEVDLMRLKVTIFVVDDVGLVASIDRRRTADCACVAVD